MPLPALTDHPEIARDRVRTLPVIGVWFAVLFVLNLVQLLSLVLWPISRRAFRRANRWLADRWWTGCVAIAERLHGTRIVASGDPLPADDNALLVVNHQQMPDILALLALARESDRVGDMKFFVKRALKWVPGVGWGMQFLSCPFLSRNWTRDRRTVERTFRALVRERIPMWLVSFVEGTRVSAAKLASSARWAAERGLEPTRHVLLPRTKGFVASVTGLAGHLDAVYDITIGYEQGVPTLRQYIFGAVRRIHVHVRRFAVDELPAGTDDLSEWLIERFQVKDELLERFYSEGAFPGKATPETCAA